MNKVTADGSTIAGSVNIEAVVITNHKGDFKDIKNLVTNMTLTESLYSPHIEVRFSIRDESNFFELFEISGNERIILELSQTAIGSDTEVKTSLTLYVIDYPAYSRNSDGQSHSYSIVAVSKIKYLSDLKLISRAFRKSAIDEVRDIITADLGDTLVVQGESSVKYSGIIPWTAPLDAAIGVTNVITDSNSAPFFLFQVINNGIIYLRSYSDMINKDPYHTYYDKTFFEEGEKGTVAGEAEKQYTLKELNSFLGLRRVESAKNGAYASTNRFFDLSTRTFKRKVFNYEKSYEEGLYLSGVKNNYNNFSPTGDKVSYSNNARGVQNNSLRNRYNFNGKQNQNDIEAKHGDTLDSFMANINTVSHEMKVNGDLLLNPGRVVMLEMPKPTDFSSYRRYTGDDGENVDRVFSRKYLVTTVIHRIDNISGDYDSIAKLITDSIKI